MISVRAPPEKTPYSATPSKEKRFKSLTIRKLSANWESGRTAEESATGTYVFKISLFGVLFV